MRRPLPPVFIRQDDSTMKAGIPRSLYLLVLAVSVVFLAFLWQGHTGFSLWDEGYLWYGAQRVMLGEVPVRDFQSYDPGRYYWSAALMSLWHDNGIMSLRAAMAIFQVLGLWAGLLLVGQFVDRRKDTPLYLLISAFIFALWMFPRHKLFDISLSIFLVGVLTSLIQRPSSWRYFIAGIGVGLVAVFGRNHGMYGVAASLGVVLWLRIKSEAESPNTIKGLALWTAGVTVGYLPVIVLALLKPGFAAAFWESIRFLFEIKTTNLPLPIPWPWQVHLASLPAGEALRNILIGLFFVALPVCAVIWLILIFYRRFTGKPVAPAFAAAVFFVPVYAHYAYSRADIGHLCQGIFPFLLACLFIFAVREPVLKWTLTLVFLAASFWVMLPVHPGWQSHKNGQWMDVQISGNKLLVDPGTANDISLLRTLAERYAPNGQSFIAAPFWPGAYALLDRKSPNWEIYTAWTRPASFEKKEIERIEAARPGFAIVLDIPLDGRDELRFKNTHPLLNQYIGEHFERIPNSPTPSYLLYKAKKD